MKPETTNEQELADWLDDYIERKSKVTSQRSKVKNQITESGQYLPNRTQASVTDMLLEDADVTRADPAFIAGLSTRLRDAYPASITTPWQRFKQALLHVGDTLFKPAKGKTMTRLTWGLTVLCTVIATLATVMLMQPTSLPAYQILAHAAEATSRQPGKVEHSVVETRFKSLATGEENAYLLEDWKRIGTTLDGNLTTVERTTAHYAADDVALTQPVSWAYETWVKTCFLDLRHYPVLYYDAGADTEGCITAEQAVRFFIPTPVGHYAEASPQTWISRLQSNADALAYHEDQFNNKHVFRLTEQRDAATLTLYIERESYQPVGFVAQTPNYVLTQIVHRYEVVSIDELAFDPFIWPPASLAEGFHAVPRQ